MLKLGYNMPWYLLGGALVLSGTALMCKILLEKLFPSTLT